MQRIDMTQISISQLQRNLHRLDGLGIAEIVDKKRNKVKGYFIDSQYAGYVEEMSQKIEDSGQKKHPKSAAGILKQYADPSKIPLEKDAWRRHVVEKYTQKMADDRA
jgi:hypothetical protein